MRVNFGGCVTGVSIDSTDLATNIIINCDRKGLGITTTIWSHDEFTFEIGNEDEDFGEVNIFCYLDEEREIFSRLRFYLEDKDQIWVLLPKQEVYM
jgi:hypothetical protein